MSEVVVNRFPNPSQFVAEGVQAGRQSFLLTPAQAFAYTEEVGAQDPFSSSFTEAEMAQYDLERVRDIVFSRHALRRSSTKLFPGFSLTEGDGGAVVEKTYRTPILMREVDERGLPAKEDLVNVGLPYSVIEATIRDPYAVIVQKSTTRSGEPKATTIYMGEPLVGTDNVICIPVDAHRGFVYTIYVKTMDGLGFPVEDVRSLYN